MSMRVVSERPPYERMSVTLEGDIAREAREHGINVSSVCREAIRTALRAVKSGRSQTLELKP